MMEPPSSNDQVLQRELDRISVEARAFEGAYKKMKAERDRLVHELEDAHKQIRYIRHKHEYFLTKIERLMIASWDHHAVVSIYSIK